MTEANLYTCSIAGLSGTMTNGDFTQGTAVTAQSAADYSVTPETWESLVWANFPMEITQNVSIESSYLNGELCAASDTFSFQPPCEMAINSHSMTADIVEGAAWGEHKLQFTDKLDAYVGPYCPDMTATRELTRSGAKLYNQALSSVEVAGFSTATDVGAPATPMVQSVDFNDGEWCSTFTVSGTDNSKSSTGVCKQINAPACELTAATTCTGTLDTTTYIMTYADSASYTANVWCNPSSLTYDWTYQYEDQVVENWSGKVEYQTPLATVGTVDYGYSHQEADYQITNSFVVDYTPVAFTTQAPVSETGTCYFNHEQTCRPKIKQNPDIISFDAETDITLQFSLFFDTTGYENCGEMAANV